MRKIAFLAMAATTLVLSACNTVEGVGEDVSSAGDATADAARDASD